MCNVTHWSVDISITEAHVIIAKEDTNRNSSPDIGFNENKNEQGFQAEALILQLHIEGNKKLAEEVLKFLACTTFLRIDCKPISKISKFARNL